MTIWKVRRGVPLLFLVYINDIIDLLIQGKAYLFADDTALFFSSHSFNLNALKPQSSDLTLVNDFYIYL